MWTVLDINADFDKTMTKLKINYLLYNFYFTLRSVWFHQLIAIFLVSDKAAYVANLFLYYYERKCLFQTKQETLRIAAIVMVFSTLGSLWKIQYFRRPLYNPVEHLWWSFCYENIKPLRGFIPLIFSKKSFLAFWCFLVL